jgi:hypothetical protein
MLNKKNIPQDLGLKIVSKEEAFWTTAKEQTEKAIETAKHEIEINERVLLLCEEKLKVMQQKK